MIKRMPVYESIPSQIPFVQLILPLKWKISERIHFSCVNNNNLNSQIEH